jgi:hypothetical protein
MINFTEIDRVLDHIGHLPAWQSDQGNWIVVLKGRIEDDDWRCHTTACVAGWTAILNGWRPVADDGTRGKSGTVVREGDRRHSSDVATEVLGLTFAEADELFYETDDLDAARAVVERWRAVRRP